jgi:hypothetical protein
MPKSKNKFKLLPDDEEIVIETKHIESKGEKVREKFLFSVLGFGGLILLTLGSFMMFINLNLNFDIIIGFMSITLLIGGFLLTSINIYAWYTIFYVPRTTFYITTSRMVQVLEKREGQVIKKEIKLRDISHLVDWGTFLEVTPKKLDGKGYYQGSEEEDYPRKRDSIVVWLRGLRGKQVIKKIKKFLIENVPLKQHQNLEFIYFAEK